MTKINISLHHQRILEITHKNFSSMRWLEKSQTKHLKCDCQKIEFNYFYFESVRDIGPDKDNAMFDKFKIFNSSSAKNINNLVRSNKRLRFS